MEIDEIFENMDPEEKARIAKAYRTLQIEADGELVDALRRTHGDLMLFL